MKKIAIIGTVGIPAKYGGFETLTEYLTKYLSKQYDITVFCSSKNYSEKLEVHNGAKLEYIALNANGIQSIPYDILSIIKALSFADTLLILGVSGCIVLPFIKIFSRKRIVVNIDGLEWKRDKWGKTAKSFLKYSEKMAVNYADVVISDNKVIQEYVKEIYGIDSKLIAYGADHVTKELLSEEVKLKYKFLSEKYAFTVCRIEPENNIHIILEAFSEYRGLNLVIVGNWGNSEYGKKLKDKYQDYNHIHLLNPIYDQKILNEIRSNCYVYLHGHSAGGTNPSLVEAMYLGLPIIAYNIDYNIETTNNGAMYFANFKDLRDMLMSIDETVLAKISMKMQQIAKNSYTWRNIATKYSELFIKE